MPDHQNVDLIASPVEVAEDGLAGEASFGSREHAIEYREKIASLRLTCIRVATVLLPRGAG
jgi:hypothetical protein